MLFKLLLFEREEMQFQFIHINLTNKQNAGNMVTKLSLRILFLSCAVDLVGA